VDWYEIERVMCVAHIGVCRGDTRRRKFTVPTDHLSWNVMAINKSSQRSPYRRLLALMLVLLAAVLPLQAVQGQADPNQGPGGPILVLTSGTTNFGRFYAEMLRTEGFNSFTVADISAVTATMLNNYDVVVLAKTSVSASQATLFTNWVNAGGNLIAMDPAPQLASLAASSAKRCSFTAPRS